MRSKYPSYRDNGTSMDSLYSKLPSLERKILDDFLEYCAISANPTKLRDIRTNILQFRDITQTPFEDVTLETLRKFLALLNNSNRKEWTKNGMKTYLKRFLRWKFKDWSTRFDEFNDIKLGRAFNQEKINENTLITPEEFELIMRKTSNYRDKALLATMYETACRPEELRKLKWKDIVFLGDGTAKISLYSGKTSTARTVLVKSAVIELEDWKQHYSYPKRSQQDLIFPSPRKRTNQLTPATVTLLVKRLGKSAGIERPIFPYLFRHTRLNELYRKLPEQIHKKFAGHTKDSRQTAIYSHITSDDVIDTLLDKVYKVEKITASQQNKYEKRITALENAIKKMQDSMIAHDAKIARIIDDIKQRIPLTKK